jgi:hypothetical protein
MSPYRVDHFRPHYKPAHKQNLLRARSITQTRENRMVMACPIQIKRTKKRTKEGARSLHAHTHLVASWGILKVNAMPNAWISWRKRAI